MKEITEFEVTIDMDATQGFEPGQEVHMSLVCISPSYRGAAQGRITIFDPSGRQRFRLDDQAIEIESYKRVLHFSWQVPGDEVLGNHTVWGRIDIDGIGRKIDRRVFEIVRCGDRKPGHLPVVSRQEPLPCKHPYKTVTVERIIEAFHKVDAQVRETQNPDGSWGKGYNGHFPGAYHPLYRTIGNHVIGYLAAYRVLKKDAYLELATRGLDYLVAEQEPDGLYKWWRNAQGVANNTDCFYPTGWAGIALVDGYRMTNERKYLDAATRAAEWTTLQPITGNTNYDAFALWFVPDVYQITGELKYLQSCIQRAQVGILPGQLPNGGWVGHNMNTGYLSITSLGLDNLLAHMPENDFKPMLKRRALGAVNHLINFQLPDGAMVCGYEYDREGFYVDEKSTPHGKDTFVSNATVATMVSADKIFKLDPQVFDGLCTDLLKPERKDLMAIGLAMEWKTSR